jgi:hypothetical protein
MNAKRKEVGKWWLILFLIVLGAAACVGLLAGCSSDAPYLIETRDGDPNSLRLDLRGTCWDQRGVEIRVVVVANHRIAIVVRGSEQVAICEITGASEVEK